MSEKLIQAERQRIWSQLEKRQSISDQFHHRELTLDMDAVYEMIFNNATLPEYPY